VVSPPKPMCLTSFAVDRPAPSYATSSSPFPGVHAYDFLLDGNGSFSLQLQAWGVSV